jgi:hypothetical protein
MQYIVLNAVSVPRLAIYFVDLAELRFEVNRLSLNLSIRKEEYSFPVPFPFSPYYW